MSSNTASSYTVQCRVTSDNADRRELLSVVVPVFNEEPILCEFYKRAEAVLGALPIDYELVFVNDGSRDQSRQIIRRLRAQDERICLVDLSRNFGKEIALTAGLEHAQGDALVVIDADLQDPPELIPRFIEKWREGFDVVCAKRSKRRGESFAKRATALGFYRIFNRLSRVHIPEDTGDFRLLSRRAAQAVLSLRERRRFMKGLFAWIGYPTTEIVYVRDSRSSGKTKWNYRGLWDFAIDGITSFSAVPLKIATYLGFLVAFGAFLYGMYIFWKKIFLGDPVTGFPSLMTVITFLGGVQLIAIGVLGEYIGRMFDEVKQRPLYLLNGYEPSRYGAPAADEGTSAQRHVGNSSNRTSW